jgi:hypothetical protein
MTKLSAYEAQVPSETNANAVSEGMKLAGVYTAEMRKGMG